MILRIIYNLTCAVALIFAPWTVLAILALGGLFLFKNFWEGMVWSLLFDLAFGSTSQSWWPVFSLTVLAAAGWTVAAWLKPRLLVNWR